MITHDMTPEQAIARCKTECIGLLNVAKKLLTIPPNSHHEKQVLSEFNATLQNLRSDLDGLDEFFNGGPHG